MNKTEISNNHSICGLKEKDLEPHIKLEGSRGKWKYKDSRTYKDESGAFHVYPYGFSRYQVYVVCPLCGETHYHGRGKDDKYWGHRTKHCRDENIKVMAEYYIERLDPKTEKDLMQKAKKGKYYNVDY